RRVLRRRQGWLPRLLARSVGADPSGRAVSLRQRAVEWEGCAAGRSQRLDRGDPRAQPTRRGRPALRLEHRPAARRRHGGAADRLTAQVSVNFDRAAARYDATRGFPPETEAEVAALLAAELAGRGRCLEIGVGTGRIAVPLRRSGVDVYGVDISVAILREPLRKGESGPLPWVAYADATALPFDDASFGAGLACHV